MKNNAPLKLFDAFITESPARVFLSILFGILSGIVYSMLIPLVLAAINFTDQELELIEEPKTYIFSLEIANHYFALLFFACCLFILFSRTLSQVMLTRVAMNATSKFRRRIYFQISQVSTTQLEKVGLARLSSAVTTDIPRIIEGARLIPDILINTVTLLGLLSFLLYLNSDVFWFLLVAIFFGIVTYQIPIFIGSIFFARSRNEFDSLQEATRALIQGSKELKLNNKKRSSFYSEALLKAEAQVLRNDKTGHTITSVAMNYGDMISFIVIGLISFIFINYKSISNEELVGVIMALLYISNPISSILSFIPFVVNAKISVHKLNRLFDDLPPEPINHQEHAIEPWQGVHFEQICYQHEETSQADGFQLGPVNFSFYKGEITFLVGGNGSGKSTLSRLITMHSIPDKGTIRFDDQVIDNNNLSSYRQCIAAIYTDYYLFERIFGVEDEHIEQNVHKFLSALQLSHVVKFKDRQFTSLALSDGQRKRLALVVSLLDNKELYLFDEWAADQDPVFKQEFYHRILPMLKSMGKAVVVVSHDERYFDIADRLITMEHGTITSVKTTNFSKIATSSDNS